MDVVLYSTGCPVCKMLENRLNEKHIPYRKCTDADAMRALGIHNVPQLAVDGELFNAQDAIRWINWRSEED